VFENTSSVNSRKSTRSLVLSLVIHSVLVIAIFAVRFAVESAPVAKRSARVQWIARAAPPLPMKPIKRVAVRTPKPELHLAPKFRPPAVIALAPPMIELPPTSPILSAPPAPMPMPVPAIVAEAPPKPKSARVEVGGFSTASTAVTREVRTVQTVAVSFGDAGTVTAVAARRSVASGGFGDAGVASAATNPRAQVRSSGFGDAVSAAPSAAGARAQAPPPATAAQILEKPRPAYTEEARRLEIEGEVQLEVVFGASGEVHILRVVRGLGHGLDENAVVAAKAIRFLPAKRDGHTVDSIAMVHIIFQLAS
jgi:TonB family protein